MSNLIKTQSVPVSPVLCGHQRPLTLSLLQFLPENTDLVDLQSLGQGLALLSALPSLRELQLSLDQGFG